MGPGREVVARCEGINPLDASAAWPDAWRRGATAVWSGWPTDGEAGPLGAWGPAHWARFGAWCGETVAAIGDAGGEVWVRPHAAHVLCDPQRCLTFLRERDGGPLCLLLDPLSMLTPGMRATGEDHLLRSVGALGAHPGVRGLVIDERDPLARVLVGLVRELVPRERPVVLLAGAAS